MLKHIIIETTGRTKRWHVARRRVGQQGRAFTIVATTTSEYLAQEIAQALDVVSERPVAPLPKEERHEPAKVRAKVKGGW